MGAWIATPSWDESARHENAEIILSDNGEAVRNLLAQNAPVQSRPVLDDHLNLLRRARADGIARAYADRLA